MFRRRRSSSHHQPLSATSSLSAQTAASHAFLKSQPSTTSLSSAAAAAALRTLTPTPTPVENVQTKRMIQRRSSVSSQTGNRPGSKNGLHRSSSSGSMSSRTFRDQSPHRPATSCGPVDAPPLPSVPPAFASPNGSHRRSLSLDPPSRSASTVKRPSGRGMSVDRQSNMSPTHPSHRVLALSTVPEVERSGSRNSINFSYPMGARQNSPRQSPVPSENNISSSEASIVHGISSTEVARIQHSVSEASHKPVKKKSKVLAPGSAEGSHFATGTAGAHPTGTALAAAQAASSHKDDPVRTTVSASNFVTQTADSQREQRLEGRSAPMSRDQVGVEKSESRITPSGFQQVDTLHRDSPSRSVLREQQPSTALEDHEGEERAEAETAAEDVHRVGAGSPSPKNYIQTYSESKASPLYIDSSEESRARSPPSFNKANEPLAIQTTASPETHQSTEPRPEVVQSHLRQSSSPGRSARFSNRLSVTGTGDILHEPPPRSVSPVKSALKHSQKNSLSPDGRAGITVRPGQAPSEVSDVTSVASDDGSRLGSRKKHVKVSFDDEAEIVGVAASPPTSPEDYTSDSPPGRIKSKTHWFGVGKKKSHQLDNLDDEFGDALKPRPTLPSFGSIRGTRDVDQQIPIQEYPSDDESIVSSSSNVMATDMSHSSDHAIGGILANAQPKKHTELDHTSTTSFLQKPTAESNGHAKTPKVASAANVSGTPAVRVDGAETSSAGQEGDNATRLSERESDGTADSSLLIPTIAVQPASPELEKERSSLDWNSVPGGFPPTSSETFSKSSGKKGGEHSVDELGTRAASPASTVPQNITTDDESGDSIYSDAAEDLSDVDGDGFGSINAIVDSRTMPVGLATRSGSMTGGPETTPKELAPSEIPPASHKSPNAPVKGAGLQSIAEDSAQSIRAKGMTQDSPYPPLPNKPKRRAFTSNSSSNPAKAKRRMSVDAYGHSPNTVLSPDEPNGTVPKQTGIASSHAQQRPGQQRTTKRPVSMGPDFHSDEMRATRKNNHSQSASLSSALRRTTSNGSDSSSSFKRSRRSSNFDSNSAMRRTMRGSPEGPRLQSPARPVSPSERRPFSPPPISGTMRTTLRGTKSGGEKSSIFSGVGKTSKSKPARFGSHVTSRYNDSDEEGWTHQSRNFRSRFADSSDEDEPPASKFRPVRGIPRRQGAYDGDSTELDDSSEDERPPPAQQSPAQKQGTPGSPALAAVAKSRGMTEKELQDFLQQPSKGRKTGLFGRLGRSRKSNEPEHRIRKSNLESPTRRDTHLERSRQERDQLGLATTVTAEHAEPSSPKLQKRASKRNPASDAWPLCPQPEESPASQPPVVQSNGEPSVCHETDRPRTSDGVVRNGSVISGLKKEPQDPWDSRFKPNGESRQDVPSIDGTASDVVISKSGRKKRFPLLRKAFGLRT